MQRARRQCGTEFEISSDDLAFLERVSPVYAGKKELIPPPTLCPDCRQRRRMAFRNQIHVYLRPSSSTGTTIFTSFDEGSPVRVMDNEEWWGYGWDPLTFGRNFDFSRPFFEQFRELRNDVPHMARSVNQVENSEYSTNASYLKNCYFVFHTTGGEDGMYNEKMNGSRDCIDCSYTLSSELCHDTVWCANCYNIRSSEFCDGCSDSILLRHCTGCSHCIGCANLRHQQYCIFNEQKTPEEYEAFLRGIDLTSFSHREALRQRASELFLRMPVPHAILRQTEDAEGNCIAESRDVHDSFFIATSESLHRCFSLVKSKDCRDQTAYGDNAELVYESAIIGEDAHQILFSNECWDNCSNLLYCSFCPGCSDCFGCVSLKKKRHCILNKQYTQSEYEVLVPKIIEHMRHDGGWPALNRSGTSSNAEGSRATPYQSPKGSGAGQAGSWGEFFPIAFSPVAYNHTIAQRYYPKTKEEVAALGGRWIEEQFPEAAEAIEASTLLDGIPETDDPIIVKSARSGRPFKITSREIQRYRAFRVPLPRLTYDERMEDRAAKLGGIRLYDRVCAKTGKPIKTTIPPEAPWIVWERGEWEREFGG